MSINGSIYNHVGIDVMYFIMLYYVAEPEKLKAKKQRSDRSNISVIYMFI